MDLRSDESGLAGGLLALLLLLIFLTWAIPLNAFVLAGGLLLLGMLGLWRTKWGDSFWLNSGMGVGGFILVVYGLEQTGAIH
jgi:hypothetical protein